LEASDKVLVVGRESGTLQRYSLPNIALTHRYTINTKPHRLLQDSLCSHQPLYTFLQDMFRSRLAINCNSSLMSVIDATGLLQFVELEVKKLLPVSQKLYLRDIL
jgi:WD repeat-containing protein 35